MNSNVKRSSMFLTWKTHNSNTRGINIEYLWLFKNLKNIELGLRCNNITNRVNYCTGTVNAFNQTLYTRNAGFNVHGSLNVYF